ncbi:MAG: NAD(P)-dependent oxidoreductase [Bauldia sp.]|nr:NAD(P)-dependent oxidoreductase [Bauldia sp.]
MIIVTGGSGKLGRACVKHLMEHGYDVTSVDMTPPPGLTNPPTPGQVRYSRADVTDFGQAMAALSMIDERVEKVTGVVHLAAIAAPGQATNHVTFSVNTLSTYNIFEAARQLGIRNVVWASSETVFGIPYPRGPAHVPVDEEIERPETAYSLSKLMGEKMAEQFCRWDPKLKIIGLRFSNVMDPQDYDAFPSFDADPRSRHFNLWTYIDARDASQAIRLALESKLKGAEVFGIANADSVMSRANDDLLDEVYPKAKRKRALHKTESLISIEKAARVLGYKPQFSWREAVAKKARGKK